MIVVLDFYSYSYTGNLIIIFKKNIICELKALVDYFRFSHVGFRTRLLKDWSGYAAPKIELIIIIICLNKGYA